MLKALLISLIMFAFGGPELGFTPKPAQKDFRESDEINQTYQLVSGARVEVSSIRGGVEIVNTDTATAEVKIIRTARTRADLEHHKIEIKQTGDTLVIRGVQEPEQRGQNIQVNHYVVLKLPRRIDLSVNSISGPIKAGDIDGQARVNSISGSATLGNVGGKLQVNSISGNLDVGNVGSDARVSSISGSLRLGQVNGSLEASSVSGNVNVTLVSLSPEGIHISSVSGSVEIGFKADVNADFKADGVSGQVYLDVPNAIRDSEVKEPNARARIGAGGTPITISSVSGNIRVTRS